MSPANEQLGPSVIDAGLSSKQQSERSDHPSIPVGTKMRTRFTVRRALSFIGLVTAAIGTIAFMFWPSRALESTPSGRTEIVFWHFWGGRDLDVVRNVVERFNKSQSKYWVREVAMPGNNMRAKLFLSAAGGMPPDLVNVDDPVIADWSRLGLLRSIDEIVGSDEAARVARWMLPAARRLSTFENRLAGVCNGLDVRALFYNRTLLDQFQLQPPVSIDDLNAICERITPSAGNTTRDSYAYLPNPRRLMSTAVAFGGDFYDDVAKRPTLDHPANITALTWMQSFSARYGADDVAAFRQSDQSLPGKAFPLFPIDGHSLVGRYGMLIDGQWRVREIAEFTENRKRQGLPIPEFGVCSLPFPSGGRSRAGWVNGNMFVIPRRSKNFEGAWAFAKFWIGLDDPTTAAETCELGGWIPVSQSVIDSPRFQKFLADNRLFAEFVDLAGSPNQFPTPVVEGAAYLQRAFDVAADKAMADPTLDASKLLREANDDVGRFIEQRQREQPIN
jgi:multiple sugar transport system substrate-binding protein